VAGYLLGFVAAVVYLLGIPAGRSHLTHLWGEDASIFLQGAVSDGFLAAVFTPYTGYLHMLPRLVAAAVLHLPIAWWAAAVAVIAAALRAGMAVLVYAATNGHLRSSLLRLVIAAALIVLPAGNSETLDNLANLHWFVLFAAFWTLLWRPACRWQSAIATLVTPLFVLTTPLGVLLAPLAAARLALPRRRDRAPAIAYFVALAATLVPIFTYKRPHFPLDVSAALAASAARGPMVTFTGSELAAHWYPRLARLYEHFYAWPAALALVLMLGLAGIAIVFGNASRRFLTVACLFLGSAVILISLYANWNPNLRVPGEGTVLFVQRYSAAPGVFFFTAIALGLAQSARPPWRYVIVAARIVVAVVIAAGVVYQWRDATTPVEGITWSEAIATAERECATGQTDVKIRTIPEPRTFVQVPCTYLRRP
jgi:hypothetical protein